MYLQQQQFEDAEREAELKEAWYAERTLLDIFEDDPKDVIAFVSECSSADLHQFNCVHGLPQEVDFFRAILSHPKCDRATALNIYAACEPAYFDRKIEEGVRPADFEEDEDRVMFEILMECRSRLTTREAWRGRFTVEAEKTWMAKPYTYPANLKNLSLTPATLRPTKNEPAQSAIIYEYSIIALSFDVWRTRH